MKKAIAAKTGASKAIVSAIQEVLIQYSTLLLEEAHRTLNRIVEEQIDCEPWTDVYRVQHPVKYAASWNSFLECVQLHLQSVFRNDSAEEQRFYISNGLKKPNRVPIRDIV